MHRIPPNQLYMHPYFMLERDFRTTRFEEIDFEQEHRTARKAVIRAGAWLVCLSAGIGAVAHIHHAASPAPARTSGPQ